MSTLVPAEQIERIVGVQRHPTEHYARAVSIEQTVYILHSRACVASTPDLRDCEFSIALDDGIDPAEWVEDRAIEVAVTFGALRPVLTHLLNAYTWAGRRGECGVTSEWLNAAHSRDEVTCPRCLATPHP